MAITIIRRVCTVVWCDQVGDGEYELLLECGHRVMRADNMCETVCHQCPALAVGDVPHWLAEWSLVKIETRPS